MAGASVVAGGERASTVRPLKTIPLTSLHPIERESDVDKVKDDESDAKEHGADEKGEVDEWKEHVEDLSRRVAQYFEDEHEKCAVSPPSVKAPQQPTREAWEQHQITHTFYQSWCPHCVAARLVRRNHPRKGRAAHIVPDIDGNAKGPIKTTIDYMYVHDRKSQSGETSWNPPYLIAVEHKHGRCWAYRVSNKGAYGAAHWLPKRMVQDWENSGFKDVRVQLKSDQEPSIVELESALQPTWPGVLIQVNSPVGESESNGRVENTIRRIQGKVRVLRHQMETNMKVKIPNESPIISWKVRWAAELLSQHSPGEDGRTPFERIRGERCVAPVILFGEQVQYLPMKTVHKSKGEAAKKSGVWFGNNERTEESIVGIPQGGVKCGTYSRMDSDNRWNPDVILSMRGTPSEPAPGRMDSRIPVSIDEHGIELGHDDAKAPDRDDVHDEVPGFVRKIGQDRLHVSRKAISRYGPTDGCAACTAISLRGHLPGKLGHNHSDDCRKRIIEEMEKDQQHRELAHKHGQGNGAQDLEVMSENQTQELLGHLRKAIEWVDNKFRKVDNSITNQLNKTMMGMLIDEIQVVEVYSPSRVAKMASDMGLRAGWSLDLTTQDTDGRYRDFNDPEMRNRAARKVLQDRPVFLIGSPMCTVYSTMNYINHARMPKEVVQQRFERARTHIEICVKLYNLQWTAGGYLIHEHPESASSWQERCIQRMLSKEGVMKVTADQCRYGLTSRDTNRVGPARKSTSFMTNSPCKLARLKKRCPNRNGVKVHDHVVLQAGRTRAAQIYPPGLCRAICSGLKEQISVDRQGQFLLMEMDNAPENAKSLMNMAEKIEKKCETVEEHDEGVMEEAWDDVSGRALDPEQVKKARKEEIEYVHKMGLYVKVPINECHNKTGKPQIIVRWIDINKGDTEHPNYRSRLVAREINIHKRDDLFAATPPLEALKTILSMTATANKGEIVMVDDISRAYFHARAERDVYVQFPEEDKGKGDERLRGKLQHSMHGTRDVAKNWFHECSQQLLKIGFQHGSSISVCVPPQGSRDSHFCTRRRLREYGVANGIDLATRAIGTQVSSEDADARARERAHEGNKSLEQDQFMERP